MSLFVVINANFDNINAAFWCCKCQNNFMNLAFKTQAFIVFKIESSKIFLEFFQKYGQLAEMKNLFFAHLGYPLNFIFAFSLLHYEGIPLSSRGKVGKNRSTRIISVCCVLTFMSVLQLHTCCTCSL